MGLTIHYSLHTSSPRMKDARHAVQQLRAKALDLPFREVGELIDLRGEACDFEQRDVDDPLRWLLIQAEGHVHRSPYFYRVKPRYLIAFTTRPGEGCEPANFGLARYGSTLETRQGKIRTSLTGWRWESFCKTQYASDPECGGLENFLRCHLCVVRLLDHAHTLGLVQDVNDEGHFWERRDVPALAQRVGAWNEMIAARVGQLKDLWRGDVTAPIMSFPDFEHLEAAGSSSAGRWPPE